MFIFYFARNSLVTNATFALITVAMTSLLSWVYKHVVPSRKKSNNNASYTVVKKKRAKTRANHYNKINKKQKKKRGETGKQAKKKEKQN